MGYWRLWRCMRLDTLWALTTALWKGVLCGQPLGTTKGLHAGDIAAIKALYNALLLDFSLIWNQSVLEFM